jgi:hypothetical protein
MASENNKRNHEAANGDERNQCPRIGTNTTEFGEAAATAAVEVESSEDGALLSEGEVESLNKSHDHEDLNTIDALKKYVTAAADMAEIAKAILVETAKQDGCHEPLLQKILDALHLANAACAQDSCRESLDDFKEKLSSLRDRVTTKEAPVPVTTSEAASVTASVAASVEDNKYIQELLAQLAAKKVHSAAQDVELAALKVHSAAQDVYRAA